MTSSAMGPEASLRMSALITVAVVAWGVFGLTAVLVAVDPSTSIDHSVQESVAEVAADVAVHAEWLRPATKLMGKLGWTPVEVAVLVVIGIVSLTRRWPIQILLLPIITYFPTAATVGIFKKAYERPEPYDEIGETGRSFPSGHSATSVAVYGGIALAIYLTTKKLTSQHRAAIAVLLSAIGIVIVVMVVRSAHWVSDIVAGAAIGTAWLATAAAVLVHLSRHPKLAPDVPQPVP